LRCSLCGANEIASLTERHLGMVWKTVCQLAEGNLKRASPALTSNKNCCIAKVALSRPSHHLQCVLPESEIEFLSETAGTLQTNLVERVNNITAEILHHNLSEGIRKTKLLERGFVQPTHHGNTA
jgi:hypothetical protein